MIRAWPHMRSLMMGLRLWGMAEEPFWPGLNASSASSTSVRCRCRTSTAIFSMVEAMIASVAMNSACRSRWMTWVEAGAGVSPSLWQTSSSMSGGIMA